MPAKKANSIPSADTKSRRVSKNNDGWYGDKSPKKSHAPLDIPQLRIKGAAKAVSNGTAASPLSSSNLERKSFTSIWASTSSEASKVSDPPSAGSHVDTSDHGSQSKDSIYSSPRSPGSSNPKSPTTSKAPGTLKPPERPSRHLHPSEHSSASSSRGLSTSMWSRSHSPASSTASQQRSLDQSSNRIPESNSKRSRSREAPPESLPAKPVASNEGQSAALGQIEALLASLKFAGQARETRNDPMREEPPPAVESSKDQSEVTKIDHGQPQPQPSRAPLPRSPPPPDIKQLTSSSPTTPKVAPPPYGQSRKTRRRSSAKKENTNTISSDAGPLSNQQTASSNRTRRHFSPTEMSRQSSQQQAANASFDSLSQSSPITFVDGKRFTLESDPMVPVIEPLKPLSASPVGSPPKPSSPATASEKLKSNNNGSSSRPKLNWADDGDNDDDYMPDFREWGISPSVLGLVDVQQQGSASAKITTDGGGKRRQSSGGDAKKDKAKEDEFSPRVRIPRGLQMARGVKGAAARGRGQRGHLALGRLAKGLLAGTGTVSVQKGTSKAAEGGTAKAEQRGEGDELGEMWSRTRLDDP
jgi:hypothetical protein